MSRTTNHEFFSGLQVVPLSDPEPVGDNRNHNAVESSATSAAMQQQQHGKEHQLGAYAGQDAPPYGTSLFNGAPPIPGSKAGRRQVHPALVWEMVVLLVIVLAAAIAGWVVAAKERNSGRGTDARNQPLNNKVSRLPMRGRLVLCL
jgi:hypothetical protein